jgi:hypothetical protein
VPDPDRAAKVAVAIVPAEGAEASEVRSWTVADGDIRKDPAIAEPILDFCGDTRVYLEIEVRRVLCKASGKVRRERLEFLADNPLYTKRFAIFVGRRCRVSTIKDVAKELRLDWETVKELD